MTIDEMIAVLQAYKEGKTIEFCHKTDGKGIWSTCPSSIYWNFGTFNYRIKPEPRYRPFKSAEEVMEAIKEKGQYLMLKCPKGYYHISCIYPERPDLENSPLRIRINGKVYTAEEAMIYFDWAYGTPFGKLEE